MKCLWACTLSSRLHPPITTTRKGPGAGTAEGRAKTKGLQMAEDLGPGVNIAREERWMDGEEERGSTHCDEDVSISDLIGHPRQLGRASQPRDGKGWESKKGTNNNTDEDERNKFNILHD
ncbi:hypothetical protein K438DRAFT_1755988 [Mycena galopus ATCC 62051]|nr:hypothetical protein K438DRAFT_1755988 [Mycena galopus ATCC 62051]